MKIKTLLFPLLLLSATAQALPEQVILFRHAEKAQGDNPQLTEKGQQRAKHLVSMFSDRAIKHAFSTDYHRTQQTIAPLAKHFGLEVTSYDPQNLEAFSNEVLELKGEVVIVGHSNTTPELVRLLSHQEVSIAEDEFNKVFVITFGKFGKVSLSTLSSDKKDE
ncbi:histidine phosphatase family protein [Pseudoalteromonas sp. MMG022]|uniref:SixA phosphatase family protein n=1 Tax=Pseudoalteromonas sp. MMG022 TaxID=2909978 RepID=UPI001F46FACA|nr:histidine phosphatase family protein [Pseudoalteromonas sp. MMG022]MCF6436692.1 histidine phosphatase family protein [Pseudoalteromonas sp. MMG022]